ncbi:MAG: glycosyl transferase [Gammaproteobacteria bacterium]|nr:MAG: glycosyl transferase [Gammaproteobacteria bacterium]
MSRPLRLPQSSRIQSAAVIGNHLPRQCGIATFTTDLVQSINDVAGAGTAWTVAMNDRPEGYDYPPAVRFEINSHRLEEYRLAAEFINIHQPDVVSLQHEYGIFGGPAGSHVLSLLDDLQAPVVTTLHTVLTEPAPDYRKVLLRLVERSDRLVVMSHRAVDILESVYGVDRGRVVYIPHGIPDMPFVDPNYYKEQFGLLGRRVLLTFGLLSQNKGIETVIDALPAVVERFPDVVYIVLGATHPNVLRHEGERYRLGLQQRVRRLGLEGHVLFQNRFVTLEELCEYLAAADIYITPYLNAAQITSGTLAYAMGTGKAVVSTPYWYAEEMLADDRGVLVPFKDPDAMGRALIELLGDDTRRHAIRKRAYDFCRQAVWREVAARYLDVFAEVKAERSQRPRPAKPSPRLARQNALPELPAIKLDHLLALTDDAGMLQHAKYTVPDRHHGYCTDDNARALIVAAQARRLLPEHAAALDRLCDRYLAFLWHAFDAERGRFRNFLGYDRRWLEEEGSEDSHGRALWGLGVAVSLLADGRQLPHASTLFKAALPAAERFTALRATAFALLGIDAYLATFSGDSEARRMRAVLAEGLYARFEKTRDPAWPWPEPVLTYDNPRLAQALIVSGPWMGRDDITARGLAALEWLVELCFEGDRFVPIGCHGWYPKGGVRARFDQQPLEAQAMVDACISAYRLTGRRPWLQRALDAFNWFLGQNDLNLPLYDDATGGCRDGLQPDGVNQNQGAESTLAWLLSLTALHRFSADQVLSENRAAEEVP